MMSSKPTLWTGPKVQKLLTTVTAIVLLTLSGNAMATQAGAPISRSTNVRAVADLPRVALPAVNPEQRLNEDAANTEPGPLRYAIPVDMSITPDNAGTWEKLADGARLWRYRVHAPGATDLNFGFTRYHLPRGATLYVISEKQDYYHGPYTHEDNRDHNQHWTPMVPGDSAVIELYLPADFGSNAKQAKQQNANPAARGSVRADWLDLELGRVGTGYRDLFGTPNLTRQGACNIDTICPQGDNWRDEIRSAAMYSQGGSYFCSGTLIMDVPGSFTPWWITANHCGINAGNASSLVVLWNFESAVCGALSGGIASDVQTGGAVWRSARVDADFTLLELSTLPNPAFNVHYAGWDATGSVPQSSMGISHPSNDEKALAINDDPLTTTASCIGGPGTPGTHWNVDNYELGMTEPGSSGSGIWNPYSTDPLTPNNPKLVGVLSGGSAACAGSVPNAGNDCYGKFSEAWAGGATPATRLVEWLDPAGTGTLMVDGADPGGVGVCGNVILESGEQCDDGNASGGDGCSATCQVEGGFSCTLPIPGGVINGLPEGGFESGTPNPVWAEASTNFGTPLCDVATCGTGGGTGPNNGDLWAWFGGIAVYEAGSVEQSVVFLAEDTIMTFAVENTICDSGQDYARVTIDGDEVFIVRGDDPTCGTIGYRTISIDLVEDAGGPYNDGLPHTLRVESEIFAANGGGSNFFFDDFTLNRGMTAPQPSVCTPSAPTCYFEDFDVVRGGGLAGWTVFNDGPNPLNWGTTDDGFCGSANWTAGNYAGTGVAACVDSDAAGVGIVNSYLCSPPIDLSTVTGANLEFLYNFQVFSPTVEDAFEVLVGNAPPSLATIGGYTSKFFTTTDAGSFGAAPGVAVSLDISDNDSLSEVYVCYRYSGDFDWYAQVDNVAITANSCTAIADTDGDGVVDNIDNCTEVQNQNQRDTDGDGIGNACDADIDNNCVVNFLDSFVYRDNFFQMGDFDTDNNGDGFTNFLDLMVLSEQFFGPPGPSAAGCDTLP